MARPNAPVPAAPPAAAPAEPASSTIAARVRTRHGDVRCRAGLAFPAQGWSDVAVTLEQLAVLEADALLEVRYDGQPPAAPPPDDDAPIARASHETALRLVREQAERAAAHHRDQLAEIVRNHETAVATVRDEGDRRLRASIALAIELARKDLRDSDAEVLEAVLARAVVLGARPEPKRRGARDDD